MRGRRKSERHRRRNHWPGGPGGRYRPRLDHRPPPHPADDAAPDVSHFTGRAENLAALDALHAKDTPAVVISAIAGAGGMGKTSLAVHWAHRVRHEFPDGQLYVNLRGYDPSPPLTPVRALDGFLRALGVPGNAIPTELTEMTGAFRSLVADRRILILLNNAAAPDQIRPLLPNTPTCLVLVTSRSRLSGLTARDGAHRITLDQLSPAESTSLLREIVGPTRTDAEPHATADLVRRCGGLPLALRIAADRIADRPHHSIADLTAELARHDRLNVLATDDENTAVRTVFDWSYRTLPPETARVFRLLGLHPGAVFGLAAAEALVGGPVRPHLETLTGTYLLTEVARDRFQFHDLIRDFAVEQSTRHDSEQNRNEALRRALSWYLHTAYAASQVINPVLAEQPIEASHSASAAFADRAEAIHWFDTEHQNLLFAIQHAAELGHHDLAARLPMVIEVYLYIRARWAETITTAIVGLVSAQRLGDPELELWTLAYLGDAYSAAMQLDECWACYEHVRVLAQRLGSRRFEASSRHMFGLIHNLRDRPELAIADLDAALTIYREIGNQRGEGLMLGMLGDAYRQQGRYSDALDSISRALAVLRAADIPWTEAWCLLWLGHTHADQHELHEAAVHLRGAVSRFGEIEDRYEMAQTLRLLGDVLCPTDPEQARQAWREALTLFEELNLPQAEELQRVLDG